MMKKTLSMVSCDACLGMRETVSRGDLCPRMLRQWESRRNACWRMRRQQKGQQKLRHGDSRAVIYQNKLDGRTYAWRVQAKICRLQNSWALSNPQYGQEQPKRECTEIVFHLMGMCSAPNALCGIHTQVLTWDNM